MLYYKTLLRTTALLTALAASPLVSGMAYAQGSHAPYVPSRLLVRFKDGISPNRIGSLLGSYHARSQRVIPGIGVHVLQLPAGASETAMLRAFRGRAEVQFAELDEIGDPQDVTPNDPYFSTAEWHLKKIFAPAAWSMTTGSGNVTIAILDTGVDGTHPDLSQKMVPGWNFYSNNTDTSDVYGHGTKVAGTAAASSNNSYGVASVAWGCKIMPIRISAADGTAQYSTAASGLTWAADHGARVANLSYEFTDSSAVTAAAKYFQSKGGVVTVAAGNESAFDASADNPYILTVSATNSSDVLFAWSNTGNNVDIAAPGDVYTTVRGGGFSYVGGTSVAAPVVAGVAALVISANPSLTGPQVQDILKQSADDLGTPGWDASYGWGRVNAARAVNQALGISNTSTADVTPPTVSIAAPTSGASLSGAITVQTSASDNVGVASVTLCMDGVAVATDTASPYNFTWDTSTTANGSHTLVVTAQDVAGNSSSTQVTVMLSNRGPDLTPPTVTITSPTDGATVTGTLSVTAAASDDVGVTRVELYLDGALKATDTSAPWTFNVNTRKWARGPHTLRCKAYDAAGNVSVSPVVTVTK